MRTNKISTAIEYLSWLLKKYNEQQQTAYRIIDVIKKPNHESALLVQITGKSTTFEITPQEIVLDDVMLEAFSRKDIRMITYLACQDAGKPKYKIVSQAFSDEANSIEFKLCEHNSNYEITIAANEIATNDDLIKKLSPEDIRCTSYTAGYEHAQRERDEIDLLKHSKQIFKEKE